jgi:hypothetical protein
MLARALAPLALALAVGSAGCRASPDPQPDGAARLALMTTLPIYWPEAESVGKLLQSPSDPSQARQTLETRFVLEPVDTLEAETLRGHDRLLLAQPRALAAVENVALDKWVRDGGRLLLFADPMLTHHSHFGIGDKRRAQDVILLSPILTHWGLALAFDPEQPAAERTVDAAGIAVPVALAGRLAVLPGGRCEIAGEGTLARCQIGRGSVTILADAAVLDDAEGTSSEPRRAAVLALASLAFD